MKKAPGRDPRPAQKDVEVVLPLTPQHHILYRHGLPIMETVSVDRSVVDEVNRYQVYFADDEIVSWKPETRPEWFEEREPPPDACENTAEGKKGRANF
jgi:hypothetical protein